METREFMGRLKELLGGSAFVNIEDMQEDYLTMEDFTQILNILIRESNSAYYEGNKEKVAKLQYQTMIVLQEAQEFNKQYGL
jgi:hypothetical protein